MEGGPDDYMTLVRDALMVPISSDQHQAGRTKVSVVGCGQVGSSIAFTLMAKNVCTDVALLDVDAARLGAEQMDLSHASVFCKSRVLSSTDPAVTAGSKVIVVTAGARQAPGESRRDLIDKNVGIFKKLIPPLVQNSPDCILLIVTNPADAMAYVAWRLSGLPSSRVIGSGTLLDSMRLRSRIAQQLCVHPRSVYAWVCGEHGDSQFPVWSGAHVNGVRLRTLDTCVGLRDDAWGHMAEEIAASAAKMIEGKGFTSWGIAMSTTAICRAILLNTKEIMPVSAYIQGCKHGDNKKVYISVPCVMADCGVHSIVKQKLSDLERAKLAQSAEIIYQMQQDADASLPPQ
ncbi:L-lactate dehydrogenase-like [Bacillus rossius redtenbacheri]|uniref:L-lactate dehydrogenase-like n=1 Tax=Bacillus rossius redtenbacheri TaxID=93214 RepID=UPI002FDD8C5F